MGGFMRFKGLIVFLILLADTIPGLQYAHAIPPAVNAQSECFPMR